jgi:hypothetical protein
MIMNQLNPAIRAATGLCGASMDGVRIKLFSTGAEQLTSHSAWAMSPQRIIPRFCFFSSIHYSLLK